MNILCCCACRFTRLSRKTSHYYCVVFSYERLPRDNVLSRLVVLHTVCEIIKKKMLSNQINAFLTSWYRLYVAPTPTLEILLSLQRSQVLSLACLHPTQTPQFFLQYDEKVETSPVHEMRGEYGTKQHAVWMCGATAFSYGECVWSDFHDLLDP